MELTQWLEFKNLVTKVETMPLFLKKNLKLIKEKKNGGLLKTGDVGRRSRRNGGTMMTLRAEKIYLGMSCKPRRCKSYQMKYLDGYFFVAPTSAAVIDFQYKLQWATL
jgi:hypothetical protein